MENKEKSTRKEAKGRGSLFFFFRTVEVCGTRPASPFWKVRFRRSPVLWRLVFPSTSMVGVVCFGIGVSSSQSLSPSPFPSLFPSAFPFPLSPSPFPSLPSFFPSSRGSLEGRCGHAFLDAGGQGPIEARRDGQVPSFDRQAPVWPTHPGPT